VSQESIQCRATRIVVDTSALRHNLQQVRELTPAAKIMAVIKADGYGHGMELVAQALSEADEFGVTDLDDVARLRKAGINKTVTILSSMFQASDLVSFTQRGIRPVIYDFSQLKMLADLPVSASLHVWLKIDTGMGRLGFSIEDAHFVLARLNENPAIGSVSAMTHLANADRPSDMTNQQQLDLFAAFTSDYSFNNVSVLNSGGIVAFPQQSYDFVRPGIMLYGISPQHRAGDVAFNLKNVMSFKSEIVSIKRMPAGSSIGYGSTYSLDTDTRIAVISAGYGDGYPRNAPTGTPVLVNGMLVPLVGRISMDLITVALGEVRAAVGDEVTLWGDGNAVEVVAESANTIAYELVCGITQRVQRVVV